MAKPTGQYLHLLRSLMKSKSYVREPIQAYIIPACDAHQSEYLAKCERRRDFISGFDGSAGTAIVSEHKAALWTDGRYFLQAESQLDENWTLMKVGLSDTLSQEEWLIQELPNGSKVGVDPFLISSQQWRTLSEALNSSGLSIVKVQTNLVDVVWSNHDRSLPSSVAITVHSLDYAGKTWQQKVQELRSTIKSKRAYAFVATALDDIAWLLNLRGSDVEYNPVFYAYALVTLDNISLFVDETKIGAAVSKHLGVDGISVESNQDVRVLICEYNEIQKAVKEIADNDHKIWISKTSSVALTAIVPKLNLIDDPSPIAYAKSIKNQVEIEGMRQAHIRDAVALCEYFCWLGHGVPKDNLTEVTGADKLEELRSEQEDFVGLSFSTISSVGSNGAIIHYRPTNETDRVIAKDSLYLCDSGAQFKDGTTDVTRTIHFGTPTRYEQECFTRVFKGHVALAMAVFPAKSTTGHRLDILARKALWDVGLDYQHGTGHGVGSFLNVHEGPQGISYRSRQGEVSLVDGMNVTIEPGYYEEGKFGIRIENVYGVKQVELKNNFQGTGFLGFEPFTLVPIQTKMLIPSMLTQEEIDWLNGYHELCAQRIGSALREQGKHRALNWLLKETETLG